MHILRGTRESERDAIHATFRAAFADYAVPADFDRPTLERLMHRRGADLTASIAAFEQDQMAAVMVTAIRDFEGALTAYDVFTGVRPAFRGRGLATRLFEASLPLMRERGVRGCVLEVLQDNRPAISAYERAGFSRRRELICLQLPHAVQAGAAHRITRREHVDVAFERWWDWAPTWQNSRDSVHACGPDAQVLVAEVDSVPVGYAVVVPVSRDLPQLAVHPQWRGRGIGRALVARAQSALGTTGPLRVINIDGAARADAGFWTQLGAEALNPQWEMVKILN